MLEGDECHATRQSRWKRIETAEVMAVDSVQQSSQGSAHWEGDIWMKYWKEVGELLKGWLSEGGWREGRAWKKTLSQDSHLCLGNHLGRPWWLSNNVDLLMFPNLSQETVLGFLGDNSSPCFSPCCVVVQNVCRSYSSVQNPTVGPCYYSDRSQSLGNAFLGPSQPGSKLPH